MSTKKIEGYAMVHKEVDGMHDADFSEVDIYKKGESSVATLVIHSGLPEPVYTQSEVRAMLKEMEDAVECVDVGSYVFCGVPSDKLNIIAAAHGFTL